MLFLFWGANNFTKPSRKTDPVSLQAYCSPYPQLVPLVTPTMWSFSHWLTPNENILNLEKVRPLWQKGCWSALPAAAKRGVVGVFCVISDFPVALTSCCAWRPTGRRCLLPIKAARSIQLFVSHLEMKSDNAVKCVFRQMNYRWQNSTGCSQWRTWKCSSVLNAH